MAEQVLYANEQKITVHGRTDGSGYVVVEDRLGETVHRSEWHPRGIVVDTHLTRNALAAENERLRAALGWALAQIEAQNPRTEGATYAYGAEAAYQQAREALTRRSMSGMVTDA